MPEFSAVEFRAIIPNDNIPLDPPVRQIYIGKTGDLSVESYSGTRVIFGQVPVGKFDINPRFIRNTGTSATEIIGLY